MRNYLYVTQRNTTSQNAGALFTRNFYNWSYKFAETCPKNTMRKIRFTWNLQIASKSTKIVLSRWCFRSNYFFIDIFEMKEFLLFKGKLHLEKVQLYMTIIWQLYTILEPLFGGPVLILTCCSAGWSSNCSNNWLNLHWRLSRISFASNTSLILPSTYISKVSSNDWCWSYNSSLSLLVICNKPTAISLKSVPLIRNKTFKKTLFYTKILVHS